MGEHIAVSPGYALAMRTCSNGQELKSLGDDDFSVGTDQKWMDLTKAQNYTSINLRPFPWNSQTVDSRTQKLQFRSRMIYLFAQINLRMPNYVGRIAASGVTCKSNDANNQRVRTRFRPSSVFLFFFLPVPLTAYHLLLPRQSIVVVTKPWPSIIYISVFVSSSRPWPLPDIFRSPFSLLH